MRSRTATRGALLAFLLLGVARPAAAHDTGPGVAGQVAFEPRPGIQVPPDVEFRTADGQALQLGALTRTHPVVLVLVQFRCRDLCPLVLEGLAAELSRTRLAAGLDYEVAAISIDPDETPAIAASARRAVAEQLGGGAALQGWHLLTGRPDAIAAVARSIGFRYAWDPAAREFAHPVGAVVLTRGGRVGRYLFGMDFGSRDLRLAIVEASAGRAGNLGDRFLLTCYHYDATTGRYTALAMNVVRTAAAATAFGLGLLVVWLARAGRGRTPRPRSGSAAS
jgi:protein SCO1/2